MSAISRDTAQASQWRARLRSAASGMAGGMLLILVIGLSFAIRKTDDAEAAAIAAAQDAARLSVETFTFLQHMIDAETGQRGFLLTGREAYLDPYRRGREAAPNTLRRLQTMTDDDPALAARIAGLRSLAGRRLALLEAGVAARRRASVDGAPAMGLPTEGKALMDAVRRDAGALLAHAQARAQALQVEADADAARRSALATALSLTAALAALILLVLALRESRGWREAAVAEARAQVAEAAARCAAEAADASKSRFLSAASHDLRQPLIGIGYYAEALSRRLPEGEAQDIARRIEAAAKDMRRTFAALLDLSRLEAGAARPDIRATPLAAVLNSVAGEVAETARLAGVTLRVAPTRAVAATDRELLESVVRNLLSNAVKATPGGRVLVGVRRDPGGARIEVRDDGPGVAPDRTEAIFEEFQHARAPRPPGGAGLGLSIARRLTDRIGGRLAVRSAAGGGALFSVTVPRWPEGAGAPTVSPAAALTR